MTNCKCGFKEGNRICIVSWDGESHKGCWVDGMSTYIGKECHILNIDHFKDRPCIAELDKVVCLWETRLLQKIEPYTLF